MSQRGFGSRSWGVPSLMIGLLTLACGWASDAAAQSRRTNKPAQTPAPASTPTQPSATPSSAAQKPSPYLERVEPEDWELSIRVDVAASRDILVTPQGNFPQTDTWTFDQATVVFPFVPTTANFQPDPADPFSGVFVFQDAIKVQQFEVLEGYPSGTKLAKWTLEGREGGYQGKQMHLEVRMRGVAYNLKFNEAEAMKLPWPSVWPPEAMEATKPEAFITHGVDGLEYAPADMQIIKDMVAKWTSGKPQSQPPVVTAKWISKQVGDMVQVSGSGFGYSRTGKIQGIDPQGAPFVAMAARGSQFDMTCLLVACLREAGIPTRMVVGYDVASDKEERIFLEVRRTRSEDIRTWAEFALYDEKNDILTWVPIDIVAQRAQSSRLPDIAKPWDYFGNHKELQGVIPFAFQFQPPTTVRAYGTPGFWGWLVLPTAPPRAEQWLTLHANSPSKRGGAPKGPRERN